VYNTECELKACAVNDVRTTIEVKVRAGQKSEKTCICHQFRLPKNYFFIFIIELRKWERLRSHLNSFWKLSSVLS
jgi:hypothetical protein